MDINENFGNCILILLVHYFFSFLNLIFLFIIKYSFFFLSLKKISQSVINRFIYKIIRFKYNYFSSWKYDYMHISGGFFFA